MTYGKHYGNPRTDIKCAINHYGITKTKYLINTGDYPLPERGIRLAQGTSIGLVAEVIIVLLVWAAFRRS